MYITKIKMNTSESIRVELSRVHFRSSTRWVDEITGDIREDKLYRDVLETVHLFPYVAASFPEITLQSAVRLLVQDVRDLVLNLRGIETIYPFGRSVPLLAPAQIETFLDVHVAVKLNRMLERLLSVVGGGNVHIA
jgi:hypothetical protein